MDHQSRSASPVRSPVGWNRGRSNLLQSETALIGSATRSRSQTNPQRPSKDMEALQNVEHIRKELTRLGKMARLMHLRELAHFIDVAGEVASEVQGGAKPRVLKHG